MSSIDANFSIEAEIKEDFVTKKKYLSLSVINLETGEIRIRDVSKYVFKKIFHKNILEEFNIDYFDRKDRK